MYVIPDIASIISERCLIESEIKSELIDSDSNSVNLNSLNK